MVESSVYNLGEVWDSLMAVGMADYLVGALGILRANLMVGCLDVKLELLGGKRMDVMKGNYLVYLRAVDLVSQKVDEMGVLKVDL